ncbi:MAG: hypothetical protein QXD13_00750 [Candidatus Pacearchaeota archaeon]
MKNKKGFEFSFGWMFAIIVGAAILFLAIYGATKLISTERQVSEAETAKEMGIILTPVETGLETAKASAPIVFPIETRIYNNCSLKGNFGEQLISTASSTKIGKQWEQGIPVGFSDKYIFSPSVLQGRNFYVFSKPFEMPFKIADLLYLWTDKYCFVNAPADIKSEIMGLDLKNVNATDDITGCEKQAVRVCFAGGEKCNMTVDVFQNYVSKKGKILHYGNNNALLYGAIFSDAEIYECQVQRLMKRASEIAMVYAGKSDIIATKSMGCSSNLQQDLASYASESAKIKKSDEISRILFYAESLERKNNELLCKLWES